MDRADEAARILADWIDAREHGEAPPPDDLLGAHPELADELREGLDGLGAPVPLPVR